MTATQLLLVNFWVSRGVPINGKADILLTDIATSVTLRHEMVETLHSKLQRLADVRRPDDLAWRPLSVEGSPIRSQEPLKQQPLDDPFQAEGPASFAGDSETYLRHLLGRYESPLFKTSDLCKSQTDILPDNWLVVNINVTEDKSTLIISRQRARRDPVLFCIPLKHRRDNDDAHLTLESALAELDDIIACSDRGTKSAVSIGAHDQEAKAAWWAQRKQLDERLKALLDNIEFCWLGAFKVLIFYNSS